MGDNKCGNRSHRCLATVSCLSTVFASCCNYLTKRSIKWPKTRKEEANAPIGRSKSTWWNWLDSCQQRAADLHKLSDLIASNVNILLWNQFQCVCVCVCVCGLLGASVFAGELSTLKVTRLAADATRINEWSLTLLLLAKSWFHLLVTFSCLSCHYI